MNADLPIELLSLWGNVNVGVLLLCSQCQFGPVPAHPKECCAVLWRASLQLTEIIDVEDAADGTARPAVSDLAL